MSIRVSASILFLPAIYNYWEFDHRAVAPLPEDLAFLCRTLNILGLVIAAVLVWCLGLPIVEAAAELLRRVVASDTERTAWREILYRSMTRMVYLAVPGAVLWGIWVVGFYRMSGDFRAISWAIGVPAHLLAAGWYVPLVFRWYRLANSRAAFPA